MTLDREQKLEPKIEGKNQNARTSEIAHRWPGHRQSVDWI